MKKLSLEQFYKLKPILLNEKKGELNFFPTIKIFNHIPENTDLNRVWSVMETKIFQGDHPHNKGYIVTEKASKKNFQVVELFYKVELL